MKILHLLASNKYAGAEHVAVDIIKSIRQYHDAVYVSPKGDIHNYLFSNNIKYIGLDSFSYFDIFRVINSYKPDIIHAHDYSATCMVALMPFKGKIISHIHHNSFWAKKINAKTIAYFLALKRVQKVVTVSQSVIDEFVFQNELVKKAVVISNAINVEYIRDAANTENMEAPIDVLFVGRLTFSKDPLRFINIIDGFKKKVSHNLNVVMIGDGELLYACQQMICSLQLNNDIKMIGFQTNPYKYMKQARVLILPSRWEGFGLAALEAMLLGTPVLSTNVGGLAKLVVNDKSGWICESNEDFVNKILKLHNEDFDNFSQSVLKYAESINDYQSFIDKWMMIYEN